GQRDIIYRGGPGRGSMYADLTESGRAQQYDATTRETFDIAWPFGNLVTHRMEGLDLNYDYRTWVENGSQDRHMLTIARGSSYCGLDEAFTRETARIGRLGRIYNAASVDRTDNSNATVYTILKEMGLPLMKPDIHAPGWGTDLHRTRNFMERMADRVEESVAPLRNYSNMPANQQLLMLQRMFGR
ncbi:MAG: hypothetical protein Q4G26_16865, partial [Paracoccus sp. (in: a-proteobacteria)]|nr:hypothetical protein [Paracoccus sp. (in: a-proteobacteria)]